MNEIHFPKTRLYNLSDLIVGYDPARAWSILDTYSFRQFQAYCPQRTAAHRDAKGVRAVAEHDAAISDALYDYLYDLAGRPNSLLPVGFMGSSSLARNKPAYAAFSRLARQVARAGFLVVTGGGPAMMEAANLGAYFAKASDAIFEKALQTIASSTVPSLKRDPLVEANGQLKPGLEEKRVEELHRWFSDAYEVAKMCEDPADSLAVSTWEYGQEPVMPFATHYAAYFQNSIREAALVRESRVGMIYGQGGGGTVREIFQDVEENYYLDKDEAFTPMIFFDADNYWTPPKGEDCQPRKGFRGMPIYDCARASFAHAFGKNPEIWESKVVATADFAEIVALLTANKPATEEKAKAFLANQVAASPTTFI